MSDLAWMDGALCMQVDPEAHFPDKGESNRTAKRVCFRCEVKVECLDYAMEHDEPFGVWGGLTEQERSALKRLEATV